MLVVFLYSFSAPNDSGEPSNHLAFWPKYISFCICSHYTSMNSTQIRIMNRSVSPSWKKKKSSIKKSWLTRQTSQGVITVKPSLSTPLTHTWLITGKSPQSLTFSGRTLLTMSGYSIFPFGKQMNKTPPFILTIYNLIARTLSSTMGLSNYIICMSELLHLLISYVLQKLWIVLIFSMLF